jgi:hypothetical protein
MEVGNKATYVGCYSGIMAFQTLPAVMPKFGIVVMCWRAVEDKSSRPKSVEVLVFLPGDMDDSPSIKMPLPQIAEAPVNDCTVHSEQEPPFYNNIIFHTVLSPFPIQRIGDIKVRVIVDDEVIKCGRLSVQLAPKPTA